MARDPNDVAVHLDTLTDVISESTFPFSRFLYNVFLWTLFFKADGSTLSVTDALTVSGDCVVVPTPGSHDDIGGPGPPFKPYPDDPGPAQIATWTIPNIIGLWTAKIRPIPVAPSAQSILGVDQPGMFGAVTVLWRHGPHLPNHAAEAGHRAFNSAVESGINGLLRSLGPSHRSITEEDINTLTTSVTQTVHDAIVNDLSTWEMIWALTDADYVTAQQVLRWDQDMLLGPSGRMDISTTWGLSGGLSWGLPYEQTDVAPAVATVSDGVIFFAKSLDGRIYSNRTVLGWGGQGWMELEGDGRTDAAPAAAVAGNAPYMFVAVKGLDGYIYINQGDVGGPYVGWGSDQSLQTDVAPAVATVSDGVIFFAKSLDGRIYSNRTVLGQGGQGWVELPGDMRTDAAPAVTVTSAASYMFVAVKGLDGNIYINQGGVSGPYVGWYPIG